MQDPLSSKKLRELLKKKPNGKPYHRESTSIEFKEDFDWDEKKSRLKYIKSIAAFANREGGYLIFGIADQPREFSGMKKEFQKIDDYQISQLINEYLSPTPEFEREEIELYGKNFGFLYVYPFKNKPIVCIKDYDKILTDSSIYYRYNSLSCIIKSGDLIGLLNDSKRKESYQWMKLFAKVSEIGVDNTAIYNKTSGELSTNTGNKFVLNEELIDRLKVIDKYSIQEDGSEAIRIVGEIDGSGTIIKEPLAINENQIIESFLKDENIVSPAKYIEACCYLTSAYIPIYYYIRQADISTKEAKKIISDVKSRARTKKKLLVRLDENNEFQNVSYPTDAGTSVQDARLKFVEKIREKLEIEINNEGELKRFLEAIWNLDPDEYDKKFLKSAILKVFQEKHDVIFGNLGSFFRKTLAYLDLIENKQHENPQL